MDILEEHLQVLLGNWQDESFSFRGAHYQLVDLDAQPKPAHKPHPPLIMGGDAGPRSARLAAAYADEYNTAFPTVADVRERRGRIAEACAAAGREMIPFSIMTTVIVGADQVDLRDRVTRVAGQTDMDADQLLGSPPESFIVGGVDQVAERLRELAQAGVDRVMCQHLAHRDTEFVALLGQRVAPLVAG
jgi:alkanesulfonate monooxygenase SsuD/methylene tetrahydromethanopterin reductase-like flavin-dependent oxidoreductase (luciferase family)